MIASHACAAYSSPCGNLFPLLFVMDVHEVKDIYRRDDEETVNKKQKIRDCSAPALKCATGEATGPVPSTTMPPHVRRWMPESVYCTDLTSDAQRYASRPQNYDLITDDGLVTAFERPTHSTATVTIAFRDIAPQFRGFHGTPAVFNLKSTLTQLGIDVSGVPHVAVEPTTCRATVQAHLVSTAPVGVLTLDVIGEGTAVGKLVALPDNRIVTDLHYVDRLKEVLAPHPPVLSPAFCRSRSLCLPPCLLTLSLPGS